jgi:hypothetical protein
MEMRHQLEHAPASLLWLKVLKQEERDWHYALSLVAVKAMAYAVLLWNVERVRHRLVVALLGAGHELAVASAAQVHRQLQGKVELQAHVH